MFYATPCLHVVSGAEAMFADLGHFSVESIQVSFCFPEFCIFLEDLLYIFDLITLYYLHRLPLLV
jgi:K+ transporter